MGVVLFAQMGFPEIDNLNTPKEDVLYVLRVMVASMTCRRYIQPYPIQVGGCRESFIVHELKEDFDLVRARHSPDPLKILYAFVGMWGVIIVVD